MKLIEINMQQILDLCKLHKVKTLSVFGSILTGRFNNNSDVDMLVEFEPIDHDTFDYFRNYFDLRDSLESLFNRKVDLIEEKGLRNKYFVALINRTKRVIYGK
ncbi:MAG: nucleotidyltransferase domain-containing protein [Muribaculaceae bacterium]|nr:nucleotidyltransferase domain-containing protein [Muribaculaceae bacterium]